MLRPRLIETKNKLRMSRPEPIETHQKVSRPRPSVSLLTGGGGHFGLVVVEVVMIVLVLVVLKIGVLEATT